MKLNINISEIENGFLVALPPKQTMVQARSQEEADAMMRPQVSYCADYKEVCVKLKEAWPITVVE